MPCWTQDQEHRLQVTLSLTGSKIVGLSLSTMLVKGRSRRSAEGSSSYTLRDVVDFTMKTVVLQLMSAEYLMTICRPR